MSPVAISQDRSLAISPGHIVKTGYVPVENIVMACRDRMAVGDIDRAYQKRIQLGDHQSWPPPNGTWQGERFHINDGRHEYIAALMIGLSHLFVAWIETAE